MKIRLPHHCTLDEAAEWLSEESGQKWSSRSVLSRFEEWEHRPGVIHRRYAPETLFVVIPAGTELLDAANEFQPVKFASAMRFSVTQPVDAFIHELLMASEAAPPGLTDGIGRRYRVTSPVSVSAIQIPSDCVRRLFSRFDALAQELQDFQQSSAFQKLEGDLEDIAADHEAELSPETKNAAPEYGELATTADVRVAFALATGDSFDKFKRALEDAPGWIKGARRDPAGKGKSAGYLWNVVQLAEVITKHYNLNRKSVNAAIAARWPTAAELYGL